MRLRVLPGEYTVSADESAGLREATLTVGPRAPQRAERPAAALGPAGAEAIPARASTTMRRSILCVTDFT